MDGLLLLFALFYLPFPWLARKAWRSYRTLPSLQPQPPSGRKWEPVTIVIPARNEAANLARLLPSLNGLEKTGPLEILVVDDASTDGTAEIAAAHGASVLPAGPLPQGWLGKPHACHRGAEAAFGQWLLFTDADTLHSPRSLGLALEYAQERDLEALSLFLAEQPGGPLEQAGMAAAFAGLFAGHHPGRPLLNGQYILVRREAYFSSGGFHEVRGEPLEDLALAHLWAGRGVRFETIRGESLAQVQPYLNLMHLWTALVRLGAGALRWSGRGGWLTALHITGAMIPLLFLLFAAVQPTALIGALATWLLVSAYFLPWADRSGRPMLALLAPPGALLVQTAASVGLLQGLLRRGATWKGRQVRRISESRQQT